jgi:phosphoglycolate phosphatase-like HAD superfamily hydrolase
MPSDAPGEPTATIVGATGPQTREYYLDLLDARELADAWTTADVAATKQAPDLVEVAIRKTGLEQAVMIGDSIWDCQAAARAGIQTIAVLTGGFSEQELGEAGALAVFDSLPALSRHLDQTPLR